MAFEEFFSCGALQSNPSRQVSAILPTWLANHCTRFGSSCQLVELQQVTKAVETLKGNNAFQYLSICSILFASSVNSLISLPLPPQFNVVLALWSVQSKKQKNQHCLDFRGEMCPRCLKIEFTAMCLFTFTHCSHIRRKLCI